MNAAKSWFYIRLTIGVLLVGLLVKLVDFEQLRSTLVAVTWLPVIAGLLLIVLNFFLKTYRWAYILQAQNAELSFCQLVRFNFISMFLAHFLPTSVASDFVRLYCVSRHISDPRDAVSSIVIDRVIGLFSLSVLAILSFLALWQMGLAPVGTMMSLGIIAALLVSIAIPLALRHRELARSVSAGLSRLSGIKGMTRIGELYENFMTYQHHRRVMVNALLMSFLNLFIAVIEFYVIAESFSAGVPLRYFFILIPLVIFLSMIPISVGGMGLLESALVFFFSKVGMPIEMCVGMAVVHRVLLMVATLPGGVLYMIEGVAAKKQPA